MPEANPYLETLQSESATGAAPGNPYLDLLQSGERMRKTQTAAAVSLAVGTSPEEYAKRKRVAEFLGYPPAAVDAMPDLAKKQAQEKQVQQDIAEHPVLQRRFSDEDFARLAHDDTGMLSVLANSVKRGWAGLQELVPGAAFRANSNVLATFDKVEAKLAAGEVVLDTEDPLGVRFMTPEQRQQEKARYMEKTAVAATKVAGLEVQKRTYPQPEVAQRVAQARTFGGAVQEFLTDPVTYVASIGPESVVQSAPSLALGGLAGRVGGMAAGAAAAGGGSFVTDYNSALLEALGRAGVDVTNAEALAAAASDQKLMQSVASQAFAHATMVGAFDAVSAGAASRVALPAGTLAARPMARELANLGVQIPVQGALGGAGELGGQVAAGQDIEPGAVLAEIVGEGFGAPAEVTAMALGQVQQRMQQAKAEADMKALQEVFKQATESATRERAPESFAALMQELADASPDAPKQVRFDARTLLETLQQSGLEQAELEQMLPSVMPQLDEAVAVGGEVVVPLGEFSKVAGTDLEQPLLQNARIGDNELSRAESKQAGEQAAAMIQQQAEQVLQQAGDSAAARVEAETVRTAVLDQLNTAGRFRADVNEAYATLVRDFYVTMAGRLKTTPDALYAQYPLTVRAEGVGGFEQGGSSTEFTDNQGGRYTISVKPQVFGAGQTKANAVMVELRDAQTGERRGFVDFDVRDDGVLTSENTKVAPAYQKRGLAAAMYKAARDAGFDIAPGRVQTDQGLKMVESLQRQGLVNKEAQGPRFRAGDMTLQQSARNQSIDQAARLEAEARALTTKIRERSKADRAKGLEQISDETLAANRADSDQVSAIMRRVEELRRPPVVVKNAKTPEWFDAMTSAQRAAVDSLPEFSDEGFALRKGGTSAEDDIYTSASSSFTDYEVVPGVRSVPLDALGDLGGYAEPNEVKRIEKLADLMRQDKEVAPIFVGVDSNGEMSIMEGQHRARAFKVMGLKAIPAKVVVDFSDSQSILAQGPRGTFNPAALNITLLQDADLSTFLHETGHFFLDMLWRFASDPAAPPDVQADMAAVLKWFKVTPEQWGAWTDEYAVTGKVPAGMRKQHERFAEGFEQYLLEGKAPSLDLQPLFSKFRSWLINVYKSLKDFLAGRGEAAGPAGELGQSARDQTETPEFKAWFGGSKVVDENGKPLVVYHGTNATFDIFSIEKIKSFNEGVGLYFTNNPTVAGSYGKLMQVYLSLQKPLAYDAPPFKPAVVQKVLKRAAEIESVRNEMGIEDGFLSNYGDVRSDGLPRVLRDAAAQLAREDSANDQIAGLFNGGLPFDVLAKAVRDVTGYDGFVAKGFSNEGSSDNTIYVAWFPEQIKSAIGNRGTFDPNDPSILAQANQKTPLGLTDEVRGVFDRLLASQEQIAQAELLRGFGPLTVPGMQPAERVAYEAQGQKATDTALDKLASRSVKDMRWTTNARSRALKALQQDAAAKRKVVEAEVAAEVAQQPIRQAMRWLRKGEMTTAEGEQIRAEKGFRLNTAALAEMYPDSMLARPDPERLKGMTAGNGLHPDVVAGMFGFTSGDELVRALIDAEPTASVVEGMTDQRMLERFGDLATEHGMQRAADEAVHNEARGRFIATGLKALQDAQGEREQTQRGGSVNVMVRAAKSFASQLIARRKVRDLKPGQHTAAEARAGKAAMAAAAKNDTQAAIVAQRDALLNHYAARETYAALDEVDRALVYLRKFAKDSVRKGLPPEYLDQIDKLLERVDLRTSTTLGQIDKRAKLADWIKAQADMGVEVELPAEVLEDARLTSYKDLPLETFRGLVDTVKQVEHLGRLKDKLLTARDDRAFAAVQESIVASILANGKGRVADTRTPRTNLGRAWASVRKFGAAHVKVATWARIMDGGKDGPVWEYFVRSANERGDQETTMLAKATQDLSAIMAPLIARGRLGGAGQFFPSIRQSLNREAVLAIALNIGNESNLQRLLGGEGWTPEQIQPVLDTLTPDDWAAVQKVWDYFETFRPLIGAKEMRVRGKAPDWIEPGSTLADRYRVKGGYYPVKYDPAASQRAEEHADAEGARRQLQGAYGAATTRRSFTKARAEEVVGRPLLYTLQGVYSGVTDVIHDLAWHEWLIDVNRLLRSKGIDSAIRETYGPDAVRQFKAWRDDIAEGNVASDRAMDMALGYLRQSVSVAGLGFNVVSAMMQPLGLFQSWQRIGLPWLARGIRQTIGRPVAASREVNAKSSFMTNRARTRFRELNELRNRVQGQNPVQRVVRENAFRLMVAFQRLVDVPTWVGAYEKAIADGNGEARAVALADQAVIDAQGGGQVKDLAAIERGPQALKLFTVFYSFMNTALNLGVASAMTPRSRGKLAADMLLLFVLPAVLGSALKDALTPGDAGDDDEELAKKLAGEQLSYLLGLVVLGREFGQAARMVTGADAHDYTGPAGLRAVADVYQFTKQASQGEFDDAFRKATVNLAGDFLGLPSAQINRSITGAQALGEGKTQNPAALLTGYQEPR